MSVHTHHVYTCEQSHHTHHVYTCEQSHYYIERVLPRPAINGHVISFIVIYRVLEVQIENRMQRACGAPDTYDMYTSLL